MAILNFSLVFNTNASDVYVLRHISPEMKVVSHLSGERHAFGMADLKIAGEKVLLGCFRRV